MTRTQLHQTRSAELLGQLSSERGRGHGILAAADDQAGRANARELRRRSSGTEPSTGSCACSGRSGMNLAVADVQVLARALTAHYQRRGSTALERSSASALERVWRADRWPDLSMEDH